MAETVQDELPEWGKAIGVRQLLKMSELRRLKQPNTHMTDLPQSAADIHRPVVNHIFIASQPVKNASI
ncbi:hypothetical protein DPMN_162877 [Dreissena polymorpha]|uniref:Uncharacterized protein n=1 Tax=Dreissena polymorpha TaxID=45954 RepID=A0A9D4IQV2_DREPO|nr:hypothetical protein DPMN_162877 [Dreissena polymorpha]